ncbi:MAG: DUF1565 domain-containing protein, partial [Kiritimatiellaeota bacterium]|nr:DUF1565 domain-containing protein [Kiritimatiellota bacterium]
MKKMVTMAVALAVCAAQAQQVWTANDGASLVAALSSALPDDEIQLAGGSYINPSSATFLVPAGVSLRGGYSSDFQARDLGLYPSVLDGNGQAINVVTIGGADVTVDGIVITGAYGIDPGAHGRGLYKAVAGELLMTDCVISNNWTTGLQNDAHGVAAFFFSGAVTMERCVIDFNGR